MKPLPRRTLGEEFIDVLRGINRVFWRAYVPLVASLVALHYPYDTDPSLHPQSNAIQAAGVADFYEAAYRGADSNGVVPRPKGLDYKTIALEATTRYKFADHVRNFVDTYQLHGKKVLEVGSGRGHLQDLVADYTGLDLSPTVAPLYHKKFVAGSATAIPFPDNSFDAIWTVLVLEHIPEPEKAMREMRRVLKPGGKLFLLAAWGCKPWLADGFEVRPYSDFNWKGKLVKASLLVRTTDYFQSTYQFPTRMLRYAQYLYGGPQTPLRFRKLNPNYQVYWQGDSDAAIDLDGFEAHLWFNAQGDTCLNCAGTWDEMTKSTGALVLQVNK